VGVENENVCQVNCCASKIKERRKAEPTHLDSNSRLFYCNWGDTLKTYGYSCVHKQEKKEHSSIVCVCQFQADYFSKLPLKCYNSIIGLSLAARKKRKL
jgi:hypothetical protein